MNKIPAEILLSARGEKFVSPVYTSLNKSPYIGFQDTDEIRNKVRHHLGTLNNDDYELNAAMVLLLSYRDIFLTHTPSVAVERYSVSPFRVNSPDIEFVTSGNEWPVFLPYAMFWPVPREYRFSVIGTDRISISSGDETESIRATIQGGVVIPWWHEMDRFKGRFSGKFIFDGTPASTWTVSAMPSQFPYEAAVNSMQDSEVVLEILGRRDPENVTRWSRLTSPEEKFATVCAELIIQTAGDSK